jgi:hypothetical protein
VSNSIRAGSNNSQILATIPNYAAPNSYIFFENNTDYQINLYTSYFNTIDIGLYDMSGNPIDLNGEDYQITIELQCYRFY